MTRTITIAKVGVNKNGRPYAQGRIALTSEEQIVMLGIARETGAKPYTVLTGLVYGLDDEDAADMKVGQTFEVEGLSVRLRPSSYQNNADETVPSVDLSIDVANATGIREVPRKTCRVTFAPKNG